MEINLDSKRTPFSLDYTLSCGQVFRWEKSEGWWYGVVGGEVIKLKQVDDQTLEIQSTKTESLASFIELYFRLDDDLPSILKKIDRDKHIRRAIERLYGLRLIRQNPWECLISFLCATYANIPRIKRMIRNLSERFGYPIDMGNRTFYSFPEPEDLSRVNVVELRKCGLGFRAKYVKRTAMRIYSGEVVLEELKGLDYAEAKCCLRRLDGVGEKVADCVLLFSLEKLETFPVDVWMKRILLQLYPGYFTPGFIERVRARSSLTRKEYETIRSFACEYFGEYVGYAQEYLYYQARLNPKVLFCDD